MIFIDFDDVIFNTKKFKEDLKKIFSDFGISEDLYDSTYADSQDDRIIKIYDPRLQVQRIAKIKEISKEQITKSIDSLMQRCPQYVFSDLNEFLKGVGSEKVTVLSYGNLDFQKEKINKSGIVKDVGEVFVTDKMKSEVVGNILRESFQEKVFFIDDRVEQIRDVKKEFPFIITILLKRPEGRYQEMQMEKCCDYQACNLHEAQKIIEKYEKEN